MNNLRQAVWVEGLKARRSRVPLLTALGFSLAPLAGGFFMLVMKDPELARRAGLISAKAQLAMGTADWASYLELLAQATAVGGTLLFGLIATWVFGREYSDHTAKDLLALPTSRSAIVLAKIVIIFVWSAALVVLILLIGLGVGTALDLPPEPGRVIFQGGVTLGVTACLTFALVTPIAFCASAGRGYLAPMAVVILSGILAQLVAVVGWGEYFPWAIPALYAGLAGTDGAKLGFLSYGIVILTSLVGLMATLIWWELADQTH